MYDPNDLIPDDMIFKTFKPRVPSFAANTKGSSGFASSSDGKYKEDGITPRICVSPSIEGCLNSLRSYLSNSDNPRRVKQEFNKGVWYVYTPLQDLSKYNIKSNLDIVKNGLVWDAKYTKETWILEDTTMVLYGIIKVDDVSDPMTKQNSDIRKPGTYRLRENMEGRFSFSWHWVKSNEALMRDKRIADIIKNAREKQSNDKTFKPDIPKTGKRKQDEIDRDKRIASAKEYNAKSASYGKQIRDFNTKLSKMIDDINSGKSGISEKEFRVFWDSGKKLRKEWKKFLEEEDDTADMFPDEQLNHWLNIIKKNKSKPTTESYYGPDDDTSGTSEFDESYDNDPNDCYCESSIFTTGDFSQYGKDVNLDSARGPIMNIRMRPATEDDTENMYNWEIDSIHPDLRTRSDVQELIRKDVDQSIKDTLMIMDGDKTIGMFTACMIDDGEWRYIGEIYLIPEYRGKGIGTSILKKEINNYDRIRLKVATTNDKAIKLYKSLGFEIIKEVDGQMYIMEYDKTKGTSTSMRLRKTDIELTKGWRVTYKGIGIYEALKNAMFTQTGSSAAWMAFINSDACNWLPKPPSYGNDNKSFFTEEGFNRFNELVLPIIAQYIDQTKIYIEEIMVPTNQIVYSDEFQFVTSDAIQESYTNTKSVSILYKRWSTKNGEQYKPIAKFWDIVEKHVKASKLQGYGTDWTGYGTDFLYGIIFKNGNIPKEVIDDVKKAFPDMVVDNSFSIPSSFEETYSGDTENIDSLYDKIWSKGFLSHELEEFTDDGKCTIRVSYKNKVSQESTIPRTNAVYLKGGEITKIENFKFNKVYFGSPNKIPSTMKLDGPLFVSPYPGIASIFAVRPQNLQKYGVKPGERINRDYDEWNHSLTDSVLQKPLTELHVKIVGAPYIKPITELVSGYLYEIEVTPDIKQHIYQSQKMDKTFEYCIDKLDTIDFSNIKKVNIRMTVEGVANNMVQEAKLPSKKRKALDDSEFALVYTDGKGKKIRKYPIYDEAHCKAAARMFPRGVPLKYQSKVARKILRRAHKFGIDTSGWKNLNKFKESD